MAGAAVITGTNNHITAAAAANAAASRSVSQPNAASGGPFSGSSPPACANTATNADTDNTNAASIRRCPIPLSGCPVRTDGGSRRHSVVATPASITAAIT